MRLRADSGHDRMQSGALSGVVVTVLFVVTIMTVRIERPETLICFFIYPIAQSYYLDVNYKTVFMMSLWALPFVACVAMFNPLMDRRVAFYIGQVPISMGWVTMMSILMRCLLAVQAIAVQMRTLGIDGLCRALVTLRCPRFLVAQLALVYRYIIVLVEEAWTMQCACVARGWGRRGFPLRMWGCFIAQLLMRTLMRGADIHQAMLARGFNGTTMQYEPMKWSRTDTATLVVWVIVFGVLRFIDVSKML